MVMNYVWLVVLMCSVQGCEVGFSGPNCSKPCQYPSFGQQCQEECNCTQDICNIITGCAECPIGFFGKLCIQACRYPGFGAQCQKTCNCSEGNCNHITGCMIIQGCEDGYFGPNCTSPCRYPNFGQRCQEECNCTERQCDASIGCKYIHGCNDGYHGPDCLLQCRYPSYGKKCQRMCNCSSLECNHITGCGNMTETFILTTVWDKVPEKERNSLDNYQEAVIIGSCSLVLVLLIVLIAKLYINKYNRQHEYNQPNCVLNQTSCSSFKITSFKSFTFNESYDPDLYENTRN
ncbi:protein draper-like isoform X1 [Crassostrea angulata]|uniref:protein draper-like isoform X1 n=1 Tax=Magallana angulata TaxID=2784310 RepID=UPI0022B0A4DF|nr:protein draper-like isoform X1 [Crassostrea angulata]